MTQRSALLFFTLLTVQLSVFNLKAQAAVINHDNGTLRLQNPPSRIVVLAFSFVDALAVAGISPVGIADDGDKNRIITSVRNQIGSWQSVGSRYQPSLEAVAALKPDLIIADSGRHQSIYQDLTRIAPTLMLKNRGVTYQENLQVMLKIAAALDKTEQVKKRLQQHQDLMRDLKKQFNSQATFQFAVISDKGMWLHSPESYAGSVIAELGLKSPLKTGGGEAYLAAGFEQLLKTNPDWLFVGQYTRQTVLDKWQKNPLWKILTVSKSPQLVYVSANVWSLAGGMLAAEQIALELASHILP
ncbi:Fe(3+) dicitrate ABC transporter substrate-binding protein [Psychromonas aquimarina]|uniref:Fe(3+) dicitrate ABC transporter substrate-binding protein n=1 Tax=Psychromonas aquimarina TaxID=444919 RepID=UPI00041E3AEA|nr:Fe(3+) dicitrate ABC transporter substrate-binding protein [Psychromonas aquimarina]